VSEGAIGAGDAGFERDAVASAKGHDLGVAGMFDRVVEVSDALPLVAARIG
jgi:hypothetical protein